MFTRRSKGEMFRTFVRRFERDLRAEWKKDVRKA